MALLLHSSYFCVQQFTADIDCVKDNLRQLIFMEPDLLTV